MGRLHGKVALITGAAQGQGRSHALRLAEEGAAIVGVDLGRATDVDPGSPGALHSTANEVRDAGGRMTTFDADVRDLAALRSICEKTIGEFGRLDVVVANAGIGADPTATADVREDDWQRVIDIDLTGAWKTVAAAVPSMISAGNGGSIVLISSTAGLKGYAQLASYSSAKHGLVGLMRSLANELAPQRIRVNTVHPGTVDTRLFMNDAMYKMLRPDLADPGRDDVLEAASTFNTLPVPFVEPIDVSNAVLWLSSDEARYVTGTTVVVDAGQLCA